MDTVKGSVQKAKKMLVGMMLGANLCTLLLLWACVLSTCVSSTDFPKLSLLGLAFPVFLCINIAFCFLWAIFHIRLIWVPLIGMLAIYGFILDYCPMHLWKTPQNDSALCIISYNVGGMKTEEQRDSLKDYIAEMKPDIVCLQELFCTWVERKSVQRMCDSLGYTTLSSGGNTILSRLPILGDSISIPYPTRTNQSLGCWVDCNGDSLLLINNHLESDHLSEDEKTDYQEVIQNPEKERIKTSGHLIGHKLIEAAQYRGSQTDTLCSLIQRFEGKPIVMCGDDNDTPISYTYQQLSSHLNEAYRQGGWGPGFSFKHSGFYIRIDHIFYSDDFDCEYTFIDHSVKVSDHYPIVTYLRKTRK